MQKPGRCSPRRLKVRRFRDESDPAIREQSVVDVPGVDRADDVFTHDTLICKQAQEARLSDAAQSDFIVFESSNHAEAVE
jgi:hypothetical protein